MTIDQVDNILGSDMVDSLIAAPHVLALLVAISRDLHPVKHQAYLAVSKEIN